MILWIQKRTQDCTRMQDAQQNLRILEILRYKFQEWKVAAYSELSLGCHSSPMK